jgi:hypothetical protein
MMKKYVMLVFVLALHFQALSQDVIEGEEELSYRHRLSIMMAFSHVPSADNLDGQSSVFIVPTWAINYDYWFTSKFGLGLHNDLVMQQYKIETHEDNAIIERSFPIAVTAVALYKASKKWTFLFGVGREFEKHENFNLISAGVEYGIELPHAWEVNINAIYENKLNAYDSWLIGIGFSKFMSPRK